MVDATTIIIGIIFIIIIAIIIAGLFYFNIDLPATAIVTTFGITIQSLGPDTNGLYLSMENINTSSSTSVLNIIPIMSLKPVSSNGPEPTEGWLLEKPTLSSLDTKTITFLNPSNSGYINYTVTPDNTALLTPYIPVTSDSKPSDPVKENLVTQIGWFDMIQTTIGTNTVTKFRSKNPIAVGGQDQYLIPGTLGSASINNPTILPVIIGVPSNGNENWLVGRS